jgi:hypothetical protein
MSTSHAAVPSPIGAVHPAVLQRRIRDLLEIGAAGLIAAALALGIIVAMPDASVGNLVLALAAIVAVLAIVALVVSPRLEVTVFILTIFLLMIYGPVKLGLGGGKLAHGTDTVVIVAVAFGALMRLTGRRGAVRPAPLLGWVLAFVATVVIEAFNPRTGGLLKVLGGFRQELQWVPFFFFGYLLMRSKKRLRQMILIVGVCALANAVVAGYQTKISPRQLATWGPGYRELYQPTTVGQKGAHARIYDDAEGEAHVRPVGLGSDSGFSGGLGLVALPFALALLATWRSRRRWVAAVLALGAAVGVLTGLGRLQVIGAALAVIFFLLLSVAAAGRVKRPLGALLVVTALAVPFGAVLVSILPSGTFSRYTTFEKASPTAIATHKSGGYTKIPQFLSHNPFGLGLGTTGAVGGFGGQSLEQESSPGASAETQYNFLADELGAPGLIVWVMLSIYVVVLVARRLRAVPDGELAILLAGIFGPFVALIFIGFSGPFLTSAALGTYFWFALGVAAYWLAGPTPRAFVKTATVAS